MRKNDSMLNTWVKMQPGSQSEIAKQLKIKVGTLTAWLFQGYVPRIHAKRIAAVIGMTAADLIREYNDKRGV